MTEVAVIGIDIGKTSFHLVALDATGAIQWKKKVSRTQLMRQMEALPRCLVGMEACCGAHHLVRELATLNHDVRLMAPQFVKPFLKSNKNDYLDAEAIAEAVQRPTMRFVPAKSVEQLDLPALNHAQQRVVADRQHELGSESRTWSPADSEAEMMDDHFHPIGATGRSGMRVPKRSAETRRRQPRSLHRKRLVANRSSTARPHRGRSATRRW